ncbi:hypothetical protein CALVIDRAFT_547034 [Calocera viscosa TUFC12733]|uniref:DNA helicase n=1 Tax=Calocera viscosa (strain TUFC12733) TaxID=1330018 RepID=A0A167I4S0_CALVF|nr:hypothetical protein CALVIDRAFT_547034 [Calocera viscosa TUFC12733]
MALWQHPAYLIIDEISMCSKDFLAKISRTIAKARLSFPPVAAKHTAPLYCPAHPYKDTEDEKLGRQIYEQFSTVVVLRDQSFLHRSRYGFTAVLITSRHTVRMQWNEAAISRHSHDTIGGRKITSTERYAILTKSRTRNKSRKERGGLPQMVPLAIGMEVMVTLNVQTDLDVANGARGQVVGIGLHSEDSWSVSGSSSRITLNRPPKYAYQMV